MLLCFVGSLKSTNSCNNSLYRVFSLRKALFLEVELYTAHGGVFCLRIFRSSYTCGARGRTIALNYSAVCTSSHCGPLDTEPIPGHDAPKAATALLLTVVYVLVCTIHVFFFVPGGK